VRRSGTSFGSGQRKICIPPSLSRGDWLLPPSCCFSLGTLGALRDHDKRSAPPLLFSLSPGALPPGGGGSPRKGPFFFPRAGPQPFFKGLRGISLRWGGSRSPYFGLFTQKTRPPFLLGPRRRTPGPPPSSSLSFSAGGAPFLVTKFFLLRADVKRDTASFFSSYSGRSKVVFPLFFSFLDRQRTGRLSNAGRSARPS